MKSVCVRISTFFDVLAVVHYDIKRGGDPCPLKVLNTVPESFRIFPPFRIHFRNKKKEKPTFLLFCGPDETRTRDPMRDRHVF